MAITTSILKGTDNNYETTAEMANSIGTDFFSPGVVDAITNTSGVSPATGSYAVNAQSVPNMTVAVSAGVAYVTATPTGQGSQLLRAKNSASENVTINANSSGSTKYDWIYLKIDATNSAAPNSSGTNAASLVASRSTNNTTDDGTPPTYGLLLAVVTVANGATSITDGSISDRRVLGGVATISTSSVNAPITWPNLTYTNITPGAGSVLSAKYTQIGKLIHAVWHLDFSASTAIGNSPALSVPVAADAIYGGGSRYIPVGTALVHDSGLAVHWGTVYLDNSTTVLSIRFNDGTGGASLTFPITEDSADNMALSVTYWAA